MEHTMQTAVVEIFQSPQIYLVMFFVGALVTAARQVTPDKLEKTRLWKASLVVLPMLFGGALCLIPDLRPAPESWVASFMWGVIAGTFSQAAYKFLRKVLPDRWKSFLGSRVERKSGNGKGCPAYKALFAAGSILAHNDWKRLKCGAGLAIATAYGAVNAFIQLCR